MSLLFNMLFRLVITFLPRSKHLLISWLESPSAVILDKFRLKLKKVGKTTRPFRYDLNQIPYDYTVEVRNGLKGLDLTDRVPDELWMESWTIKKAECQRIDAFKVVLEKTLERESLGLQGDQASQS